MPGQSNTVSTKIVPPSIQPYLNPIIVNVGKRVFEDHPISCDQTIDKEEAGDGDWRIDHRIEPSSNRKKMKPCSQEEWKNDPQQEKGTGKTRHGKETGTVVNPGVSINSGENS